MADDLRVAVVGGGIGGLVLAIALGQRDVRVQVFEQVPELREIGAGIALSANATRLLERLGLGERLAAVSAQPSALVFRRWDDGRVIAAHAMDRSYRAAFGAPYYTVHRADLQRVLLEAIDAKVIRLGCRCVEVEDGVEEGRLAFDGGEAAAAHVVLGADGVHSAVRERVAEANAAVYSGTVGFRGLVPIEALPSLPDPSPLQFWAGPGRHLLHYPIAGGSVINFLAVVRHADWTGDAWMEPYEVQDAVDAFAGWHPAVTEMVGAVDEINRWALHDHAPLRRWSVGRVALLGDAAHAMLPHQGQGANQTIEDVIALVDLLADARPEEVCAALERYEALRRPRTARVQRWSRLTADCLHLPDGPAAQRRDAALAGELPARLAWIHGHDVQQRSRPL
jgi:salicylate hydroxylase